MDLVSIIHVLFVITASNKSRVVCRTELHRDRNTERRNQNRIDLAIKTDGAALVKYGISRRRRIAWNTSILPEASLSCMYDLTR